MITFRPVPPDAVPAADLLTEYFTSRELGFTGGTYVVRRPDPAVFAPPVGAFLVAYADDGDALGCGGVRRLPADPPAVRFEVKHVWVRASARGRGLGRRLLAELEARARTLGATEVVLDTNASLAAANALYRSAGYVEVAPYNDNPNATTWFAKDLTGPDDVTGPAGR